MNVNDLGPFKSKKERTKFLRWLHEQPKHIQQASVANLAIDLYLSTAKNEKTYKF